MNCRLPVWVLAGLLSQGPISNAGAEPIEAVVSRLNREAGPTVPTVKRLDRAWIAALPERGEPRSYTRANSADLAFIGMPVSGIGTGELYLGGDGKLWWWDIFNTRIPKGDFPVEQGAAYMKPPREDDATDVRPIRLEEGFGLRIKTAQQSWERRLDRSGFPDISFSGAYPLARVDYRDPALPVDATLEAMSPFVPLAVDDSNLPATVLRYTIRNHGPAPAEIALVGWLENGVMLGIPAAAALRRNERLDGPGFTFLNATLATPPPPQPTASFEDWRGEGFTRWTRSGDAFGLSPQAAPITDGASASALAAVSLVKEKKSASKLTSRSFTIKHSEIEFLIAGTSYRTKTCLNLVVDGKVVRTATGRNSIPLAQQSWDVREFLGRIATLEIVDAGEQSDGHIAVGAITFVDHPMSESPSFGSMGLGLRGPKPDLVQLDLKSAPLRGEQSSESKLVGSLERKVTLAPGATAIVEFLITWNFPNATLPKIATSRSYGKRFPSAFAVAAHVVKDFDRLVGTTEAWSRTWNDSTLPHWLLDRTFANTSTLATSTTFLVGDGRYYAYEGVYSCPGTCAHVYHYAQAAAHLFPELERGVRHDVDLGIALEEKPNPGVIGFRAEYDSGFAVDAQAGTLLRVYREHRMSANDEWLKGLWPRVKQAYAPLFALDPDGDGILEGEQMNTLDKPWFGRIAWLSGLYLAAVRAGEEMAKVCGDATFAARCHAIAERGYTELPRRLFADGYFINEVDTTKPDTINSGTGCEIDQVLGQSWAFQDGLPRVLPRAETRSALQSLWRNNFTTDLGRYRAAFPEGRWFGAAGEAGMVMCTFPRADWDYRRASGAGPDWAAGYFDEVMSGFEHQVAAHLLWENMVTEALAVERAIDERYDASKRNPWNEVECGSHYGRAMASYGVFLAACGFDYDGPRGRLGFAPRLSPENFRAAFTTAEGWGSFAQKISGAQLTATLSVKWGSLRLRTLALAAPSGASHATVTRNLQPIKVQFGKEKDQAIVNFSDGLELRTGDELQVTMLP